MDITSADIYDALQAHLPRTMMGDLTVSAIEDSSEFVRVIFGRFGSPGTITVTPWGEQARIEGKLDRRNGTAQAAIQEALAAAGIRGR